MVSSGIGDPEHLVLWHGCSEVREESGGASCVREEDDDAAGSWAGEQRRDQPHAVSAPFSSSSAMASTRPMKSVNAISMKSSEIT